MFKNFFKFISCVFLLALFVFAQNSFAQVTNYPFAYSSGTYTEITGGSLLGTTTNDDTNFPALPLGFTFNFNGVDYTQASVNSNGFLAMGATVVSSYTALSSGTSNNVIAALNNDLQGGGTGSELTYKTEGSAPNRVFIVQWKLYKKYGATGDNYNFQIRLNETSNTVQLVYGTVTNNATATTMQVGLRGASSADFHNRTTTTDWAASTKGTLNTQTMALSATIYPTSGATYTFTTPNFPPAITYTLLGNTTATGTNGW
jgi:hypothetical protein